jgi:hypothetical protein
MAPSSPEEGNEEARRDRQPLNPRSRANTVAHERKHLPMRYPNGHDHQRINLRSAIRLCLL